VNVAPETCRAKTKKNKLDLLHLVGIYSLTHDARKHATQKKIYIYIYQAIVKSTIIYAAETRCLKAKTVAKLNSTEMDFLRRSARISRKDKIRNNIIKK
jgi:hypothetical protein